MKSAMERAAEERAQHRNMLGSDIAQRWASGTAESRMMQEQYACFQNADKVFDGGDDKDFRVIVPLSGGLDSSTAYAMAVTAEMPVIPVYVDTGAAYADLECNAAREVVEALGGDKELQRLTMPVKYKTWDYVDAARNTIIVHQLARSMQRAGHWGEIWFGNNAQWRESQQTGSDKCARFFGDMQAMLYLENIDARLVNPLQGMQGGDIINWWKGRGLTRVPLDIARSCYSATSSRGCGQCRSCFFRAIAFAQADINITEQMDAWDASEHVAEIGTFAYSDMTTGERRTGRLMDAVNKIEEWNAA